MTADCRRRSVSSRALLLLAMSVFVPVLVVGGTSGDAAATNLRIMPLGDSLTDGYNVPGGYRIALEDALTNSGRPFDFVGGRFNGPVSLADQDHEGHVGFKIAEIDQNVEGWLTSHPADAVLLMIGTNDLKTDDLTTTDDAGAAAERLATLVRSITDHDPGIDVYVSTIPPQGTFFGPARAIAYNALIPGVVSQLQSQGRSVKFVDGASELTTSDLADQLHLTAAGYAKVANAWYEALTTPTPPPPPPSSGGSVVGLDGFGRADSSVLGAAEVGGSWVTSGARIGVVGGRAGWRSGFGEGVALLDVGVADVSVESRVTLSSVAATPGLSFRAVDSKNQLMVSLVRRGTQDRVSLYRVDAGSYKMLSEVSGFGLVLGGSYVLRVDVVGSLVSVFVDGGLVLEHELVGADAVTFGTRTGVGLRTTRSTGGDDGGSRWDDVRIVDLSGGSTTTTTTTTTTTQPTTTTTTTTTLPPTTTTTTTLPPTPPPPPPSSGGSVVGLDGFGRADSSVLGAAEVGGSWVTSGARIGVVGERAGWQSGFGEGVALLDVGVADVSVESRVTLSSVAATPGLSFRAVDSKNQLMVSLVRRGTQDRVSLYRVDAGSYKMLSEVSGFGLVLGGSYVLRVDVVGSLVSVFVDGGLVLEHELVGADAVTFGTRTGVGLRTTRSTGGDDGGSRWDDVRIVDLSGGSTTTTTTTTTTTQPTTTTTTTTTLPPTTTTTTTLPPTPPPPPPSSGGSVVGLDGFGRADSSVLGAAEVGGSWVTSGARIGVVGERAGWQSGFGEGVALLDVGVADVSVESRVTLSSVAATPGLSFRAVDSKNQLMVSLVRRGTQDRVSLYRVDAGSYKMLSEVSGFGLVLGGSYVLRVDVVGSLVSVFVDGGLVLEHELVGADAVTFGTRTGVGLRTTRSTGGDDGGSRWDDVRIVDLT